MIVTEGKSSIRYKESRRKWVPRAAEENVVIQNQTTCTIFHHQGGWWVRVEPTRDPPSTRSAASHPRRPKKSICTWHGRKRDRLTVVKGTKLNMFQAYTRPVRTVYGKVLATYLFSLFVLLLSFLIDTADENYKRLLRVWRFFLENNKNWIG